MSVPLEDLALLGDTESAALVSRHGDVVWLCVPRFDSPACFAALLGNDRHGSWSLRPQDPTATPQRRYRDDTLVLETTWQTADGVARVHECMPVRGKAPDIVRVVEGVSGRVPMRSVLRPRFHYGEVAPWVHGGGDHTVLVSGADALYLRCGTERVVGDGEVCSEFAVAPGERVPFVLTWQGSFQPAPRPVDAERALSETEAFWSRWAARTDVDGEYAEDIRRSLVVLKALTYAPTGGMVAAVTTSLPESIGGSRNWDYRAVWLRDASLALRAFVDTGHAEEAAAWRDWLLRATSAVSGRPEILYSLEAGHVDAEWTVDWLPGYESSSPVRVGNAAAGQLQLDVFGEVVTALHHARARGLPDDPDGAIWVMEQRLVQQLERVWDQPDSGIWEQRSDPQQHVHSKVLAWAAVDRAVKDARERGADVPLADWENLREQIRVQVLERGWDAARGTFTQAYGASDLDAALLRVPPTEFLPWDDPRVAGTVDAVVAELGVDGLLRRYRHDDGLAGEDHTFIACGFWLAECQARLGRLDDARRTWDRTAGLRNDVGLLSEEYDHGRGRLVGNIPQAFSHVPLITSALAIREVQEGARATRTHSSR